MNSFNENEQSGEDLSMCRRGIAAVYIRNGVLQDRYATVTVHGLNLLLCFVIQCKG